MYICNFLVFVATRGKNEQVGKSLCNGKFRFEFPETSFDECQWHSIFGNFRKRVQPYEVYQNFRKLFTGCEFPFHLTFRPEFAVQFFRFSEIQLFPNRLHTFPGIFGTICHVPVSKFSEFLVKSAHDFQKYHDDITWTANQSKSNSTMNQSHLPVSSQWIYVTAAMRGKDLQPLWSGERQ